MELPDLHRLAATAGVPPQLAEHYGALVELVDAAVERRLRVALEDLAGDLGIAIAAMPRRAEPADPAPAVVHGLDPHALYSRETLARRWDIATETVRKIPAEELPPAAWKGSGVRYRGADVLRYEGVPAEEAEAVGPPPNVLPLRGRETRPTLAAPSTPRRGRRPKAGALPKL